MKITIDESIKNLVLLKKLEDSLGNISGNTNSVASQSFGCAISIMQKYQKIEKIVKTWSEMNSFDSMVQISEVLEE